MKAKKQMSKQLFWFLTGSLWGLATILAVYAGFIGLQNLLLNLLIKGM